MVWLKFIVCVTIILFAGQKLARYGDAISEKTGLGRVWIGLLVMAGITTMPELATSVSAVVLVGNPDLAAGTLLGTCIFNLAIIAILDIFHRRTPVLSYASPRNIPAAGIGILLLSVAAGSIIAGQRFPQFAIGWISIPSILILIIYLVAIRRMYHIERNHSVKAVVASLQYAHISGRTLYLRLIASAVAIIGAGIWLSLVGDEIAYTTGWGASFVGTLFLAVTSSAPELAVSVAALRIGAIDLTVANILGANILDVTALVWADLSYTRGPLFSHMSTAHITTAMVGIVMSLIVISALHFKTGRKTFVVSSWYAPLLIGLYCFAAYALFTAGLGVP